MALVAALVLRGDPTDRAGQSWLFFGVGGVCLLLGVVNQNPVLGGAGIGLIAGSIFFVWWSSQRSEQRNLATKSLGDELGLSYSPRGDAELSALVGSLLFGRKRFGAPAVNIRRVLSGTRRNARVKLFEGYYEDGGVDWSARKSFVAAIADCPVAGDVTIKPATWPGKIRRRFEPDRVDLDEEFDARFMITSPDPAGARTLIDAALRHWLLSNGQAMSFLIRNGVVLGISGDMSSPRRVLDTVVALRAHLGRGATPQEIAPHLEALTATSSPDEDARSSGVGSKIAVGLLIALVAPIGLFVAFIALAYIACVTGNGCL